MTEKIIKYYWEDMPAGSVRDLGSITPTAEEIIAFATQFDPQPFHLDAEAAKDSVFGGLCASGWHTCAMAMRLMVTNFLCEASSQGSPGLEHIKWLKPVFPGDTLHLKHTVVEARPMSKRPDVGLVRTKWDMVNQHGEPVLHMEGWGMFRRRNSGSYLALPKWADRAAAMRRLWPDNAAWTSNPSSPCWPSSIRWRSCRFSSTTRRASRESSASSTIWISSFSAFAVIATSALAGPADPGVLQHLAGQLPGGWRHAAADQFAEHAQRPAGRGQTGQP